MTHFRVVFELDVDADQVQTHEEAAAYVDDMLKHDNDCNWQYYVQEKDCDDVFSVDLSEEEPNQISLKIHYSSLFDR